MGLLAGIWAVGKWLVVASVKVVLWAVTNPLGAIFAGAFMLTAAQLLRAQPWAGSDTLASLIGPLGRWLAFMGGAGLVGRALWTLIPLKYQFLVQFLYFRILHWIAPFAIKPQLRRIEPGVPKWIPPAGPVWEGPPWQGGGAFPPQA